MRLTSSGLPDELLPGEGGAPPRRRRHAGAATEVPEVLDVGDER